MNVNNEYDDDFYETSDFDMIHIDEEYTEGPASKQNSRASALPHKNKSTKKKRRLEDWLEEKRLRDELRDENLDA